MKNNITQEEIKQLLMWFHGEEFEKYPFIENDENGDQAA